MERIMICGYRDWSYDIFKNTELTFDGQKEIIYIDDKESLDLVIDKYNPEMIFFVGWSWIVEKEIIEKYNCICLHASKLPKYRGGSSIQHQLINGDKTSAVTLFKMTTKLDAGDILFQEDFSLDGNLIDIFRRIVSVGSCGVSNVIEGNYRLRKQDDSESTYYKRRTPDMSEIKLEDFKSFTAEQLHNKIRGLQNPYPNAFIVCKNGTKLYLTESNLGEKIETN